MIRTALGVYLHSWEARKSIGAAQGNRCVYCAVTLTWDVRRQPHAPTCATLEHIVPKTMGGADQMSNLAVSCHRCNNQRGSTPHGEFLNAFNSR